MQHKVEAVVTRSAMIRTITLIAALLCTSIYSETAIHSLDSSSTDSAWTVRNANGSIEVPAVVPGGIYTDLRAAGVLTQDIYYRFNDINYRWVSRENWTYSRNFIVEEEFIQMDQIFLVFHGVDTVASVYLNDKHIGNTDNMFVRYSFPVKSVVQRGENRLEVRFESSITAAEQQYQKQALTYPVLPTCVPDEYRGECHVNHLRKMQASFSWDWGPAFPSAGLWKKVVLYAFVSDVAILQEVTASAKLIDNTWLLQIGIFLEAGKDILQISGKFEAILELDVIPVTEEAVLLPNEPGQFNTTLYMQIPKDKVELWWPNELGSQKLYNLSVRVKDNNDYIYGQMSLKIGFRTIELVQEPVESGEGLTFYIKINNVPIFSKGSNWIPSHVLPEKSADPDIIYTLLSSAKAAHMNMLRVWGGGMYESDLFYQLADELGILIWQDFMFACSLYPTNSEFLQSVKKEVTQQVRRLHHHPSVVIWAGNNENEAALRDNWYGSSSRFDLYKADYIKLYVDTIRPVVLAEDSTRPYIVSSPTNGIESEREGYIAENPYSSLYGDVHYYNYIADAWNPNNYPNTRFASEYGFQSFPSLKSLSEVSIPSDLIMQSAFIDHRQHHPGGNSELRLEILQHLQLRNYETPEEEFPTFIYFAQINQAMSIKTATEFYRRGRSLLTSDGQGVTMGALYWQLNDIWQGASWSSLEFGGKWKMLHYFARNFFAPALVSPSVTTDGDLQIHLISDYLEDKETMLRVSVYRWNSLDPVHQRSSAHTLHNASVTKVFSGNLQTYLNNAGCEQNAVKSCFLHFSLFSENGDNISPDNFLFPGSLKELTDFEAATITIKSVTPGREANTFEITIETNRVALFVWLEASDIPGEFSDNGFLLITQTWKVEFNAKEEVTSEQLKGNITIISLADTY
ncbi:Beta-mannosidase [Cryptotermes secundus]|uniref:Beta-mannosidase n=1 Tax=Cryptotermes secundus TaxID=105785 RepID=A0A2J7PLP9_9NEOP|nr:beta-mannosidase isoform X2 [Cryptotermes secundus]XP_023723403.1 beta-mannosidase isoform X2 [Cryptotermes secundus]PNF17252.1 Beta-mannosidase [Cryptotermes secundus]